MFISKIPTYIIHLKERMDRQLHILKEFENKFFRTTLVITAILILSNMAFAQKVQLKYATNQHLYLYYVDKFDELVTLPTVNGELNWNFEQPNGIISADTSHMFYPIIHSVNDSIYMNKNGVYELKNNKLVNVFKSLSESIGSNVFDIKNYKSYKMVNDSNSFKQVNIEISKKYNKALSALVMLMKKDSIAIHDVPALLNMLKYNFLCEKMYFVFYKKLPENSIPSSFKSEMVQLRNLAVSLPLLYFRPYRILMRAFNKFDLVYGQQKPNYSLKDEYQNAKKIYFNQPELLNYVLFATIKYHKERVDEGMIDAFKKDVNDVDYLQFIEKRAVQKADASLLLLDKNNEVESYPNLLQQYKGKIILVNFWATWCKPCIEEIPHELELLKNFNSEQFHIINISIDEFPATWKHYIHNLPALARTENLSQYIVKNKFVLQKQLKFNSIPQYFLYDKKGVLQEENLRPSDKALIIKIKQMIKE